MMMKCDEYQQLLSVFVDQELDVLQVRQLFKHLGTCNRCWKYYRRIEALRKILTEEATETQKQTESWQPDYATAQGRGGWLDRRAEPRWMKQRVSVTPASFLLGTFVAFVVGVLLMLLVSSVNSIRRPGVDDQWAGPRVRGPNSYPTPGMTSEFTPPSR